jgi:hypothetical protein
MMSAAIEDVIAERQRQVSLEGWTDDHDDTHDKGELAGAASCYAMKGVTYTPPNHYPPRKTYAAVVEAREHADKNSGTIREAVRLALGEPKAPRNWPWDASWWKPLDRRSNLVKAAALLIAEIERLDRRAFQ